jgi:exopolysaccharide biosynthesis polyprenyl glycosylphosphotransferase
MTKWMNDRMRRNNFDMSAASGRSHHASMSSAEEPAALQGGSRVVALSALWPDMPAALPVRSKKFSAKIVQDIFRAIDLGLLLLLNFTLASFFFSELDAPAGVVAAFSLLAPLIFAIAAQAARLYELQAIRNVASSICSAAVVWSAAALASTGLAWVFETPIRQPGLIELAVVSSAVGALCLAAVRKAQGDFVRRQLARGAFARRIAILGTSAPSDELIDSLEGDESVELVGSFRFRPDGSTSPFNESTDLRKLVQLYRLDCIVLFPASLDDPQLRRMLACTCRVPVDVQVHVPVLATHGFTNAPRNGLVTVSERPMKHWSGIVKRSEDIVLASLILVLTIPVMLLVSLLIKVESPGPILFRQSRFGYDDTVIGVLKFRTMYMNQGDLTGANGTVPGDVRVTRVGRIVRKLSLDELPQLINVLAGEMSLVGPRAHAVAMQVCGSLYHEAFDEYCARHRVKPGITGWAQVHGYRGPVDTYEKARARLKYDLEYIENWSLWMDLKILVRTFGTVIRAENAV